MQSITNGKKHGITTALGLVSGIIIHVTLIAFGISEVLKKSENLFFTLKFLGALYLFYLAFKVYKSSEVIELNSDTIPKKSLIKLYQQGFLMNVLNPKVAIFFLAFFPKFINYTQENIIPQIISLGLLFMLQAFVIFSIISFLADKMTRILRDNKKFHQYLKTAQIIIFIGIGIFILL